MKRPVLFLLLLCLVLPMAAGLIASAGTCYTTGDDADGVKTAAGSCKTTAGNLKCGPGGNQAGLFKVYANGVHTGNMNQSEIEACNDGGAPNTQGRLVARVNHNATNPGARVSLDSDKDQTPSNICCGQINAQVGAEGTGVWCGPHGGTPEDGYARPWGSPGSHGGPTDPMYCIPGQ